MWTALFTFCMATIGPAKLKNALVAGVHAALSGLASFERGVAVVVFVDSAALADSQGVPTISPG